MILKVSVMAVVSNDVVSPPAMTRLIAGEPMSCQRVSQPLCR